MNSYQYDGFFIIPMPEFLVDFGKWKPRFAIHNRDNTAGTVFGSYKRTESREEAVKISVVLGKLVIDKL